jgi:hypothetical protein
MEDKLVMLLSADWFFPHWHLVGAESEQRSQMEALQQGCRTIVKQFVGHAKEYWHVSFAPERMSETAVAFEKLLASTKVPSSTISSLQKSGPSSAETESASQEAFILFALTERLRTVGEAPNCPPLEPETREAVLRVSDKYDVGDVDWEQICLKSATPWDRYLRTLSPDQPTLLADFLVAEVLVKTSFRQLWAELLNKLNSHQREELMNWYRCAAKAMMGIELPFSKII